MKFSVVTATFKSERTIRACLDSVSAQAEEHEHMIVDGASKDGTVQILKECGARFISEPDKGVYDAFNKGLAMSAGDVVSFLGSDDEYFPDTLTLVKEAFERNPGTLCIHGNIVVEGKELRPPSGFDSLGGAKLFHPATFMRRELFEKIGDFDIQFTITSDLDLFLRAKKAGFKFVHLDKPLTKFALGGLSTASLLVTAREVKGSMLKNGCGVLSSNIYWLYMLMKSGASILKRRVLR